MFSSGKQPGITSSSKPAADGGTVMREAEHSLLRAIVEGAPEVVTVIGQDGTILRTFDSRDALFGFERGEVLGRNLAEFVHPEDLAHMQACFAGLLTHPEKPAKSVLRLRNKQGQYLELQCTAANRLADPRVAGIVVYSRDASEQVALERRLELGERMEAVGRMTSGIAHDFNNVLAVIELCATRALAGRGDREQQLVQIRRAATRASSLTRRLLSFARAGETQPRTVLNLCRVLRELAETLSSLLPESITFEVQMPEGPRYIIADEAQVEQVIMNLVFNARDALRFEGRIGVSIRDLSPAGERSPRQPAKVVLAVCDDGDGMDEATRRMALTPFFTTKAAGTGTGLGLWTVRDFAQRAGGTVNLTSEPGRGTLCEVVLPTVDRQGRFRSLTPMPFSPPRAATVLLVEDEPALRETVAELLRDGGHEVLTARDGQHALDLARRSRRPIDALITDLIMPRVGGLQLATTLRAERPDLAILFVTGYGDVGQVPDLPRTSVLRKPFPAHALMHRLSLLLGKDANG